MLSVMQRPGMIMEIACVAQSLAVECASASTPFTRPACTRPSQHHGYYVSWAQQSHITHSKMSTSQTLQAVIEMLKDREGELKHVTSSRTDANPVQPGATPFRSTRPRQSSHRPPAPCSLRPSRARHL